MKNIHPALKPPTETKFIQLRTVPAPVHKALKVEAVAKGETLEQHIVNILAAHAGLAPF